MKPKVYRNWKTAQQAVAKESTLALNQYESSQEAQEFVRSQKLLISQQTSDICLNLFSKIKLRASSSDPSSVQDQKSMNQALKSTQSENILNPSQSGVPQLKQQPNPLAMAAAEQHVFQPRMIEKQVREEREREVNNLLVDAMAFKKASFQSSHVAVDPSVMYYGYFDGCSKSNPGVSGIGYHIDSPHHHPTTLIQRSAFIGLSRTNNQAQMIAMGLLLGDAYCNGITYLNLRGDSQLAISLLNGTRNARQPYICSLLRISEAIRDKLQHVEIQHIGRGYNAKADKLCNSALKPK